MPGTKSSNYGGSSNSYLRPCHQSAVARRLPDVPVAKAVLPDRRHIHDAGHSVGSDPLALSAGWEESSGGLKGRAFQIHCGPSVAPNF